MALTTARFGAADYIQPELRAHMNIRKREAPRKLALTFSSGM